MNKSVVALLLLAVISTPAMAAKPIFFPEMKPIVILEKIRAFFLNPIVIVDRR
jgi:hypothetical protein